MAVWPILIVRPLQFNVSQAGLTSGIGSVGWFVNAISWACPRSIIKSFDRIYIMIVHV